MKFKLLLSLKFVFRKATKIDEMFIVDLTLKVHIFWEGHKILQNLHQSFDWQYIGQIIGGDFAKFCGLLRSYELYAEIQHTQWYMPFGTENSPKSSINLKMNIPSLNVNFQAFKCFLVKT